MTTPKPKDTLQQIDSNNHFGIHLTLEGYGASRCKLEDRQYISSWLCKMPGELGMHKIAEPLVVKVGEQNQKDPGGISGFVLIAESHISIHTFPLRDFLTADVYTCQNQLNSAAIEAKFRAAFDLQATELQLIRRGLHYPKFNVRTVDSGLAKIHFPDSL